MKKTTIHTVAVVAALLLILLSSATLASAQYVEPERTYDTTFLFPKTPFDSIQARTMLEKGTATIKGSAYIKSDALGWGDNYVEDNLEVDLFPLTPYFEEYLALRKKNNTQKRTFARIHSYVPDYMLTAIANNIGNFTFPDMKPGKYYLEAVIHWDSEEYGNVETGHTYTKRTGKIHTHYQTQYYTQSNSKLLSKIVEIKKDGEVVNVKMTSLK
ncbi:MAG: hypothetical protein QM610_01830 [Chitinophagaceae bacterium]